MDGQKNIIRIIESAKVSRMKKNCALPSLGRSSKCNKIKRLKTEYFRSDMVITNHTRIALQVVRHITSLSLCQYFLHKYIVHSIFYLITISTVFCVIPSTRYFSFYAFPNSFKYTNATLPYYVFLPFVFISNIEINFFVFDTSDEYKDGYSSMPTF